MTFKAKITLKYDGEWTYGNGEFLPKEHITMEFPSDDLSTTQLFAAYRKFLLAAGFSDSSIPSGALSLAFNEYLTTEQMRKSAEEYDLVLVEDYNEKLREIVKLEGKIIDLKAKLSRAQNPDNPNYTDEEVDAMTYQETEGVSKKTLEKAYQVCVKCGNKYGEHKGGCSSWWKDKCDVCGETAPVTEARDFKYLKKGIEELSK